jgi:16S rRNA (uracil1498-N3)-methyltransferase
MRAKDGVVAVPDRELARQITRVLRLPEGAPVELFDGSGRAVSARFTGVSKEVACFEVVADAAREDAAKLARRVDLYPSLIKNDHLSLVVEKATELGASRVVPVVAARSVKRDANRERLARIARESAEQCGRTSVPEVGEALGLPEALVAARASGAKIVALDQDVETMLAEAIEGADHVALFVGPEGGWDDRDRDALAAGGAIRASLGGFVLRAETAAIVGVALAAR